ncbi:hypothetical protein B0H10DRAFT_824222 [Mycena sp. CBHHK59/15]|nr:hypothetical protein B0H10DRAFT_824222 [Mycena sp. CBHHK59/15]
MPLLSSNILFTLLFLSTTSHLRNFFLAMVTQTKTSPTKVPKKKKSGGLRKKRQTDYNKFMTAELARLKAVAREGESHKDRWAKACENWKLAKEHPSSP